MNAVMISSGVTVQSLDGNASAGYYTQISTEIVWEEKSVTQSLVTNDEWNVTSPSVSNDTAVEFNVSHMVLTSLALLLINLAVIIGNILVLLAVYFERALRTVTNYFIVNLAIADLLLGTLVLPFSSAFEVIHYWPFGDVFCDIWAAVDVLCCTASINSLCCISVDRYIGVTRPLKHRLIMTPKRAIAINIFVWFISFGIAVGPLFGWRPVKTSQLECPLSDSVGYVFFSVAGSFYIPSAVIIVLYFRIYRAVSHETKSIQNKARKRQNGDLDNGRIILRIHVGNNLQSSGKCSIRSHDYSSSTSRSRNLSQRTANFNREKKVAKTLGIVVSVFIICWLPFFFLLPLTSVCSSCKVPQVVFTFFFWLGYCNSCVNPVIYAMSNLTFRRAFRKILTCWFCRDHHPLIRRSNGSRRCSNLSRLTSSTPMSSPLVTNRRKRLIRDTSLDTSLLPRGYRPRRIPAPCDNVNNHEMDSCRGDTVHDIMATTPAIANSSDVPKMASDIVSTTGSESTIGNNIRITDNTIKPDDKLLLHQIHSEKVDMETIISSNNVFNDVYGPLENNIPLEPDKPKSQIKQQSDPIDYQSGIVGKSEAFTSNSLINNTLSRGILNSRETPV
ncbi:alpha-1A adrenergic receptor-like [Asterias amurensis]|uniref:alpha-1A adrenergic receptor-like n=1 Tax=Asterias amurensis TaxID=7602 RepID=UPI003AB470B6